MRALCQQQKDARAHEHLPLTQMGDTNAARASLLFHTLVVFDHDDLDSAVHRLRPDWTDRRFTLHEQTPYSVTLYAYARPELTLQFAYAEHAFTQEQATQIVGHLLTILQGVVAEPTRAVRSIPILSGEALRQIDLQWN
ncbi:condensation domain-containing protein, partial [Lysobacter sp. A3-1-A15]|uniref:condensation domain-containing protein n=1 Tax=Novilysobacter viscosus TaxID=3098602 RepID=UPI002ED96B8D